MVEVSLTQVSNSILTQPIMIHPMHSLERKRNEVSYDFCLGMCWWMGQQALPLADRDRILLRLLTLA